MKWSASHVVVAFLAMTSVFAVGQVPTSQGSLPDPCTVAGGPDPSAPQAPRPTHIRLMPAHYTYMADALDGLQRTGVPLVAFDGTHYFAAGRTGDVGFYVLMPELVQVTHLPLARVTDLFFLALVVISSVVGLAGYWRTARGRKARLLGIVTVLLLAPVQWFGGEYMVQSAIALAIVPWLIAWWRERKSGFGRSVAMFAAIGLALGCGHIIRLHAGTAVALFAFVLLASALHVPRRRRVALALALVVAFLIPVGFSRVLAARRDAYLLTHSQAALNPTGYVFWHTIYIGFGFLSNPYVAAYDDRVAAAKVCSISPDVVYTSVKYYAILRAATLKLVKEHPFFAIESVAAKMGVIGLYLLLGANLGLAAAYLRRKPLVIDIAFALALLFDSLIGVLAVPSPKYMLGFIAFAVLYGVHSLQYALEPATWATDGEAGKKLLR
jgi:hypothetical protein